VSTLTCGTIRVPLFRRGSSSGLMKKRPARKKATKTPTIRPSIRKFLLRSCMTLPVPQRCDAGRSGGVLRAAPDADNDVEDHHRGGEGKALPGIGAMAVGCHHRVLPDAWQLFGLLQGGIRGHPDLEGRQFYPQ